ncbi:MAG: undecaprenyl-diphosphatase UppP [Gemmataceae bacterium]
MSIWDAILLGVVQGLTEFLPISSTAHLLVARQQLGHPHPEDAFTVVVQLGTLVAVFWYFRTDIAAILNAVWGDVKAGRFAGSPDSRLAWLIVLGTIPGGLAGLVLKKWLKATFYNVPAMAVVAIVFALLMAAAEWWAHRQQRRGAHRRDEKQITVLDALWVGVWQALALMPGGSRSGCTITGGLFAGLTRPAAARFSFLLSLPIMLAAGLKELYDEYKKLKHPVEGEPPSLFASGDEVTALVVGTVVAAVVGYLSIAWLLRFLQRYSTGVFVGYRLVLGAVLLALVATGVLTSGR